jgi:diguanylate cyclase (GGDEF)-like protein
MLSRRRGEAARSRSWSLRREWSRAFAVMLALLLLAAIASIVGMRSLVDQVSGPARQLRLESTAILELRTAVVSHEQTAHIVLSGDPIDVRAYLVEQAGIAHEFDTVASVFADSKPLQATVNEAHRSWQDGLETFGLWGDNVRTWHGVPDVENRPFGASSDGTVAMLDGLEGPSLDHMDSGLQHGADLETFLVVALTALFGLASAVTVYFRRRMTKDLVRPVERLRQGVLRLQAGQFGDRIEIPRHDELGELAAAFNAMAGDLQRIHAELTLRASRDELTGLANRATFVAALTALLDAGGGCDEPPESVLFVDIDDFKLVNDSVGHEGGDALLIQMAARFSSCVRGHDLVARLGGDEFAIVVTKDGDGSAAVGVADRILDAVRAPFVINGIPMSVTVSIGVAERLDETVDAAGLLRQADFAMYLAKGSGKDRFQRFDAHADPVTGRPVVVAKAT